MHPSVKNAVIMSVAFFLVFTAFSTAQNYASSGGGTGPIGTLYGTMVVTNLFMPKVVAMLGPRASMLIGSFTYALFTAAWIPMSICPPDSDDKCDWGDISLYILYGASVVIGIGASILWVAQGVFIAKLSATYETDFSEPKDNRLGYFNGMFWMIYQGNQFVGNMLAAGLSQAGVENWIIFTVLSVVCLMGVLMFFFLQKPVPRQTYSPIPTAESVKSSGGDEKAIKNPSLFAMIKLWGNPKILLLAFLFLYSGASQAYIFGELPLLVDEEKCDSTCQAHKFYLMACFGAIDAVCSISFGKVSDTIGRLPIVLLCSVCHFGAYAFVYFLEPSSENGGRVLIPEEWYYYFLAGLMFGVGDAGFNTQMYAITQAIFSDDKEAAVSNLKFFQSIAMGTMFILTNVISYDLKIYICVATLVCAVLPLFLSSEVREREAEWLRKKALRRARKRTNMKLQNDVRES